MLTMIAGPDRRASLIASRAARALLCAQGETPTHGYVLDSLFAAKILACAYSLWTQQASPDNRILVRTAPPAFGLALGRAMIALSARFNRRLTGIEVATLADQIVQQLAPLVAGRVPAPDTLAAAPVYDRVGQADLQAPQATQATMGAFFPARPFSGLALPPAPSPTPVPIGEHETALPEETLTSGFPRPPMPGGYVPYGETDNYNNGFRLGQLDARRAHNSPAPVRMQNWVETAGPYYRFAYEAGVEMAGCWLQHSHPEDPRGWYVERAPWSGPGDWPSGRPYPGPGLDAGAIPEMPFEGSMGAPVAIGAFETLPREVAARVSPDFTNGTALGREDVRRARTGVLVRMAAWIETAGPEYLAGYRYGVQSAGGALYPRVGGGYMVSPGASYPRVGGGYLIPWGRRVP